MREPLKSGSSSSADYRQCSRGRMLLKAQQATQLLRPFSRATRKQFLNRQKLIMATRLCRTSNFV
eukprot:1813603-Ditylum_brightwellii.AAC.1